MATFAARRLGIMNENVRYILAVELLAAAQGIDMRRPLTTSKRLEEAHAIIRREAEVWREDRYFKPDIERVKQQIDLRAFGPLIGQYLATSH